MLPKADDTWTIYEAAHLLNRAGFGGSPAAIQDFHELGRYKAVDGLISPAEPIEAIPPPEFAAPAAAAANDGKYRDAVRSAVENAKGQPPEKVAEIRREAQKMVQREARQQGLEAQGWWFRRKRRADPWEEL